MICTRNGLKHVRRHHEQFALAKRYTPLVYSITQHIDFQHVLPYGYASVNKQ